MRLISGFRLARNAQSLNEVATFCEKKGATVSTHRIDIRDLDMVQTLVTEIDQQHVIDLIICNAGVTSHIGANGEPESWDAVCKVIDTNLI